jgi:hypothetical protein
LRRRPALGQLHHRGRPGRQRHASEQRRHRRLVPPTARTTRPRPRLATG